VWTEKRRVATRDGELAVVERGDPESPAIVLLHGLGTSSFLWRHLIPLLAPWTHVVAPDLLGAGDSAKPAEADYGLEGHVTRVRELVDALDIASFAAVGHAEGGGIAQLFALEGRVAALGLLDTVAFDAPHATIDAATGEVWVRALIELGMSHRERLSDPELEEYLRPWRDGDATAASVDTQRAVERRELVDLEPRLAELEVPTFVVWGEDDRFLPVALAERLGDVLPDVTVALLPGCGHLVIEDAPETVAPLLFQWLRSRYLGIEHRHEAGPVAVELGRRPAGSGEDA
jgi:pimeloyl-ACP methyl ester carboxylesterase